MDKTLLSPTLRNKRCPNLSLSRKLVLPHSLLRGLDLLLLVYLLQVSDLRQDGQDLQGYLHQVCHLQDTDSLHQVSEVLLPSVNHLQDL